MENWADGNILMLNGLIISYITQNTATSVSKDTPEISSSFKDPMKSTVFCKGKTKLV